MRKEAHNTGPIAELEYWRSLSVKFNFLLEQIKSDRCRWCIQTLAFGKSKFLKPWLEFEGRITDNANEAKDNVKFLNSLEQVCMPLYCADPGPMMECVPNLVNVVTNIHNISRYYNTSQRMTSLYVKVTNQMVNSLRKYMTDDGKSPLWDQPPEQVIERIEKVDNLNEIYKKNFQAAKQKLQEEAEAAGKGEFELSEMYIFGKLDYFSKRLHKIAHIINTIEDYHILTTMKMEGIDNIATKFKNVINSARNKPYDVLDTRKAEFDKDFNTFTEQMKSVESMMEGFMDTCFDKIKNTDGLITLIIRFRDLNLKFLDPAIQRKYANVLTKFIKELDFLKRCFLSQKEDPPFPKNIPDTAGRLIWIRQLLKKLMDPCHVLQNKCPDLLKTKEARKVIKNVNALALVLMEYEIIQVKKWENSIDKVKQALHSNILIRQNDGTLTVNWNNVIAEVAKEVVVIERLELDCPDLALETAKNIDYYKSTRDKLQRTINKFDNLRLSVPQIFQEILQTHIDDVNKTLRDGVLYVLWSSLNHNVFFKSVDKSLGNFELVLKKVEDIKEARIDSELRDLAVDFLIILPDESVDIAKFLEDTKGTSDKVGAHLSKISEKIRTSVLELLKYLATEANMMDQLSAKNPTPEAENFKIWIDEIFQHFREKFRDALVKCIKFNVDMIRKRVFYRTVKPGDMEKTAHIQPPLFNCFINLEIPNVTVSPSLDTVQTTLSGLAQELIKSTKMVQKWNKPEWAVVTTPKPSSNSLFNTAETMEVKDDNKDQPNYFKSISENKDISKLALMVASSINGIRQPIAEHLVQYNNFKELWADDRTDQVEKFKNDEPLLTDWRAKILYYERNAEDIEELPTNAAIGPFDLDATNVKQSLLTEIRNWKVVLCRALNEEYAGKMKEMISFFDEQSHALSRNVADLDDVRCVMGSLSAIRHQTLDIDNSLGPIEEAYAMLNKFEISVDPDEANQVDTLRYTWQKVQTKEKQMNQHLIDVQTPYHEDLVAKIEEFEEATTSFESSYDKDGPNASGITPQEASVRLAIYQTKFDDLWRKFNTYSAGETLFGLDNTDYPMLHRIKKELGLLQKLYGLYNSVMDNINGYYDILWVDVDIEAITNEISDFQNRCRKLPKALKEWQAYIDLQKKIDDFGECIPLLELMTNKAMLRRHWDRIENLTKYKFDVESENFLLRNIMEAPLLENKEDIEDICISAVKEKDIESKLNIVINDWSGQELFFSVFKSRGELLLKGQETSDTVALMEDSLMILSSLMSNRYNAPFKKKIQEWVQKLSNTTDIIEQWLIVQNLWVYLEAVFVGGDIAKQLPQEAKRFAQIDKTWVKIMMRAHENTNVVHCCVGDETMSQLLPHLLEQLEQCQKSLTGYLEQKRLVFPRFFFVSDPALLEILGQASDSHTIQAHLLGIFENVAQVQFHDKEYNKICAFTSKEGETVPLDTPVMAQGNVELWLGDLMKNQQAALHTWIRNGYNTISEPSSFDLMSFLTEQPSQIGLLGIQMLWTLVAEEALKTRGSEHKRAMVNANNRFQSILNSLIDHCTQELAKFDRVKFETLVIIHVHQRDIFDDLVKQNCKTPQEFEWLKQARFYFDQDTDKTIVSITDVDFIYQNEFMGCSDRLVVTPLTDRCFITLAQALGMSMGGAPAGPAGTGKTETTKDMAKALGKYCVVFNCSDQMDFRGLGRIYKGLAQSGSWGCFDEFNRIDLPVLSVAAQQIYIVLQARKEKKPSFVFTDGDIVSLNPEFGLFITMNPGYAAGL